MMRRIFSITLGALLALAVAGCGTPSIVIEGELRQNGQPYKQAVGDEVQLLLMGESPDGRPVWTSGTYDPSASTFKFLGPVGKGVHPGKYKIAVSARQYMKGGPDRFNDEFSEGKTSLTFEVKDHPSTQHIVVDVGTKTVSGE